MFSAFNMLNNILNNIFFLCISIIIDVGLIRFTKQNLERKRRLFAEEDKLKQAIMLKENVTKLIITNGLLYFVSHMPEFAVTILLLVFEKKLGVSCQYHFMCSEFIEIAQTFNFFSMGFQFFVFKHFDKNFQKSLENIRIQLFKKKENK